LFKTHGKKTLKSPIRPRQIPKPADAANKKILPDENTWLWEAFDLMKKHLDKSILPLHEYVKTFGKFDGENKMNPDRYVKSLDEGDQ
jgi:hypothetical protein